MTGSAASPRIARDPPAVELPRRSAWLLRGFRWSVRRFLRKHFHGVRLARGTLPQPPADVPLVIVLNHPSWWDPMVGVALSERFPDRAHYAAMEARALARYRLFEKLGFYPVEPGSVRGAAAFLRITTAILDQPGACVWITAQGRFTDPRVRPVQLKAGVGHLAHRLHRCWVVPLALEYPFWSERLPEALARFGEPIHVDPGDAQPPDEWLRRIEAGLEETQDALAADARARDPAAFETLLRGDAAMGGLYDAWRRSVAWLRGEKFQAEHSGEPEA